MSSKNKEYLKGRFANGCVPDETDFEDLLDSGVNKQDDVDATIPATAQAGHVPSSGAVKEYVGRVAPTKDELTQLSTKVSELETAKNTHSSQIDGLQREVQNVQKVTISGNVTNNPDNEDIVAVDGVLKMKDRTTASSEKGYVILRQGSLTQQITAANTIYEVRYLHDINGGTINVPSGCVLRFCGGKLTNGTLVGSGTIISAEDVSIFSSITIQGTWNCSDVFVDWFSPIADGASNDWQIFRQISTMMSNTCGRLIFPKEKTFFVSIPTNSIVVNYPDTNYPVLLGFSNASVVVEMNGCTIRLGASHSISYRLVNFYNCSNSLIRNGHIIGDRIAHDYSNSAIPSNRRSAEWGYGVVAHASDVSVENMEISNMIADAVISLMKYSNNQVDRYSNLSVTNCELHHCRRQGASLSGCSSSVFRDTKIHHIGTFDGVDGTNPKCGIDIEFENNAVDYKLGDHYFDNVEISNCDRYAFVLANATLVKSITFANCNIYGGIQSQKGADDGVKFVCCNFAESHFNVNNCDFSQCNVSVQKYAGNSGFGRESYFGSNAKFDGCKFYADAYSFADAYASRPACTFNLVGDVTFKNCDFVNISSKNSQAIDCGFYNNASTFAEGKSSFIGCSFENCGFRTVGGVGKTRLFDGCNIRSCRFNYKTTDLVRFVGCDIESSASPYALPSLTIELVNSKLKYSGSGAFNEFTGDMYAEKSTIEYNATFNYTIGYLQGASSYYMVCRWNLVDCLVSLNASSQYIYWAGVKMKRCAVRGVSRSKFAGRAIGCTFLNVVDSVSSVPESRIGTNMGDSVLLSNAKKRIFQSGTPTYMKVSCESVNTKAQTFRLYEYRGIDEYVTIPIIEEATTSLVLESIKSTLEGKGYVCEIREDGFLYVDLGFTPIPNVQLTAVSNASTDGMAMVNFGFVASSLEFVDAVGQKVTNA